MEKGKRENRESKKHFMEEVYLFRLCTFFFFSTTAVRYEMHSCMSVEKKMMAVVMHMEKLIN